MKKNKGNTKLALEKKKDMGDVVGKGVREWICHTDKLTYFEANNIQRLVTIDFSRFKC